MRRNREDYEEKIEALRTNHQREVQRILAQQALEHSASRVAEMQRKLDTQEVSTNILEWTAVRTSKYMNHVIQKGPLCICKLKTPKYRL